MLVALVLFSTFCAGLLYYWRRSTKKQSSTGKLPPGPPGWPILGNLDLMGPGRHKKIQTVGEQFGGIFTMRIGVRKQVWLTSYKVIREAVVNHAWEFAGRPEDKSGFNEDHKGIVSSGVSEEEKEVRRFTLVTLRNYGFGKTSMQDAILHEASALVEELKKKLGTPFNPRIDFANAAGNVIAGLLLGEKFQKGDDGFQKINESVTEGIKFSVRAEVEEAFPVLRLFGNTKRTLLAHFDLANKYLQKVVNDHVSSRVPEEPRDFIDTWLDQEGNSSDKTAQATFVRGKLPKVAMDIFIGGFETTTTSFQWMFGLLLTYPELQDRIHAELDEAVGKGTLVTLEHRDLLLYTEAFIHETLRLFPLVPFAVPHMCTKDATIGGHLVPEGTTVILHLYSVCHDPELWDQPEEVRPDRFIRDGKLVIPDYFLPFSAGRRSCIGEQLARKELFLFFANIMQNFRIVLPDGVGKPSLEMQDGIVIYPPPFDIAVELR